MVHKGLPLNKWYLIAGAFVLGFFLADLLYPGPAENLNRPEKNKLTTNDILLHAALDQADLSAPLMVEDDPDAASGMCIGVPEGAGGPPAVKGHARIPFEVKQPGKYQLWFRVHWNDDALVGRACSNSFFLRINDGPASILGEDGTYGHWHWIPYRKPYKFMAGEHSLTIENREDGARLDQILITPAEPKQGSEQASVPRGVLAADGNARKVLSSREIQRYHVDAEPLKASEKIIWEEHEDPVVFSDDFMRTKGEFGAWKQVSGAWEIYSVRLRTKANPFSKGTPEQLSSNAFVMLGQAQTKEKNKPAPERALIQAGHDFWQSYKAQAAVKVPRDGSGGLAVYLQKPAQDKAPHKSHAYWQAVLQGPGLGQGEVVLSRVEGQQAHVVKTMPIPFWNDQWYRLGLSILADTIQVSVDGVDLITKRVNEFKGGSVGLVVEKGQTFFDDVNVDGLKTLVEDFSAADRLRLWKSIQGKWTLSPYSASNDIFEAIKKARLRNQPLPHPEILKLVCLAGDPGYCVTGNLGWKDYEVCVDALPTAPCDWGVVMGFTDPNNTYLVRSRSIGASPQDYVQVELVKRKDGKETILFEERGGTPPGEAVHIRARMVRGILELYRDEKQLVALPEHTLASGRVGFWSDGRAEVFFDDFKLKPLPPQPPLFAEHLVFKKEDTMKDWARKTTQWVPGKNKKEYWHRRSFRGQQAIHFQVDKPTAGFAADVALHAEPEAIQESYRARLSRTKDGLSCQLLDGDEILGDPVLVPSDFKKPLPFVFEEVDDFLRLGQADQSILVRRKKLPRTGDRIAMVLERPTDFGLKRTLDPNNVNMAAAHVRDYFFDVAPVDWAIGQGQWEIVNRWRCQPQWSWMGGESTSVASLWSKHRFLGDTTLDVYSSFQMNLGKPVYRLRDLNLAFCADDWNLWSGYTFIYGGYGNQRNALFRKGLLVAETTKNLLPSSHVSLHRRWFNFRVEKEKKDIRIFLDDKLLLKYEDPDPLPGGRTALWTNQNGMMVARVRVSFSERMLPLVQPASNMNVTQSRPAKAKAMENSFELELPCHPSWGSDFESATLPWSVPDASPVHLGIVSEDGNQVLEASNRKAGGDWNILVAEQPQKGVQPDQVRTPPDLSHFPILTFDYKWSPDVRMDLFFEIGGTFYRIKATGADYTQSDVVELGPFANFKADGTWRSTHFHVLEALRYHLPEAASGKPIAIKRIFWAVHVNKDYLFSGKGGNPTGSSAVFDQFYFVGQGKTKGGLRIVRNLGKGKGTGQGRSTSTGKGTGSFVGIRYAFSKTSRLQLKNTQTKNITSEANTPFETTNEGLQFVHAFSSSDATQTIRTRPLLIDQVPPRVALALTTWDGGPFEIPIEEQGVGLDLRSARLDLGQRKLNVGDPGFAFDFSNRSFQIDPAQAGIPLKDNHLVFELTDLQDLAGKKATTPIPFKLRYDKAKDTFATQFPSPTLTSPEGLTHSFQDFETDDGAWKAGNPNTRLVRMRDPGWPNGRALRIGVNEKGPNLWVQPSIKPFNAARFPLLSFDYRMEGRLMLTLTLSLSEGTLKVPFPLAPAKKSIESTQETAKAKLPDALPNKELRKKNGKKKLDEKLKRDIKAKAKAQKSATPSPLPPSDWRRTKLDLGALLKARYPKLRDLTIRAITIQDNRAASHDYFASLWIDNFGVHGVAGAKTVLQLQPGCADPAGLKEAVVRVSREIKSNPDHPQIHLKGAGPFAFPPPKEDGLHWVQAQIVDGAGNATRFFTFPLLNDVLAPQGKMVNPKAGSRVAAKKIEIRWNDPGSATLDLERLKFHVNGTPYDIRSPAVRMDRKNSRLSFEPFRLRPHLAFPNSKSVMATVTLFDGAGNGTTIACPPWIMDYTKDKTPPLLIGTEVQTLKPLFRNTFETGTEGWTNDKTSRLHRPEGFATTGQHYLSITSVKGGLTAISAAKKYALAKAPYVSFHYKITPDAKVGLIAYTDKGTRAIRFTDTKASGAVIGDLKPIADNRWHQITFNIKEMLDTLKQKDRYVLKWAFLRRDKQAVKRGISFSIDNFTVLTPQPLQPVLELGIDESQTGLKQIGVVFDSSDKTQNIPLRDWDDKPVKLNTPRPFKGYLHVQVVDGAGNASKVVHRKLWVPAAK